jgi:alpha-ketoglutaric semialdehyde dehydrogenase
VCYQNLADELLPDALRDANPLNVRRRFAGKPETPRAL